MSFACTSRSKIRPKTKHVNSPGLAQGVSNNGLELEIQLGMKQKQSNGVTTVDSFNVFVEFWDRFEQKDVQHEKHLLANGWEDIW